ncbi:hypothetical protein EVAR_14874_1 [Eumeta japonica]|uniref:Uncharacterized protein n=1 Tax=Eumeta variegata TaxID=151549 RepID=A0A4C1V2Z7_EUMVA|nr:hypothetical protein EVAR_14874_1 [Eumeta japonica]
MDETWFHYDSETKLQSKTWKRPSSPMLKETANGSTGRLWALFPEICASFTNVSDGEHAPAALQRPPAPALADAPDASTEAGLLAG